MSGSFDKDIQYYKFCLYGFLKNLRFYEPFLLLFLLNKLEDNMFLAMSLYSIRYILRTALEIPSGVIADALGRKGTMLFSYSLYLASFISYYLANSYYFLLIPTILFGIADAFRTGTHKAMIIDYLNIKKWGDLKTEYYGRTRSWSQTGSAISAIIAAALFISTGNYNVIFLFTIIPYLIGFILLAGYPVELNGKYNGKASSLASIKSAIIESWKTLGNIRSLRILFSTSYYFGYHHAIKDLLQPIVQASVPLITLNIALQHDQKTALILGVTYTIIYFISATASRKAGAVSKLFASPTKTIKTLGIIGVLFGMLIAISFQSKNPILAILFFLPLFAVLNMQRPAVIDYVSVRHNKNVMATVLSVESQLGSLTGAILALFLGALSNKFSISVAVGIISLFSVLVFLINYPRKARIN